MKNKLIRLTAVLLCLVLAASTLCACSENKTVYVYGSKQISESVYRYWLSYYKSYFINRYSGTDSDEFFQKRMSDGKTYGASMLEQARANVKMNLICLALFDQYSLSLTDEETKAVEQTLSARVADFGSKETMNEYLAKIGMDYDQLHEVLLMEAKVSKLTAYLYGDSTVGTAGAITISDEEVSQFYQKHYAAFKLILIRTDGKNVLDEAGKATKDETGNLITEPFTEAEIAEKAAAVTEIEQRLNAGESFDDLASAFNQDADGATYPEGYLVSDFYSVFSADITEAVQKLAVDGHATVKDDVGYEIIMRVGLPSAPYNDEKYSNMMNGFRDYLNSANFSSNTADAIDDIRANDTIIEKYDIRAADISFFTYAGAKTAE